MNTRSFAPSHGYSFPLNKSAMKAKLVKKAVKRGRWFERSRNAATRRETRLRLERLQTDYTEEIT